jgi:hypothetical protein
VIVEYLAYRATQSTDTEIAIIMLLHVVSVFGENGPATEGITILKIYEWWHKCEGWHVGLKECFDGLFAWHADCATILEAPE